MGQKKNKSADICSLIIDQAQQPMKMQTEVTLYKRKIFPGDQIFEGRWWWKPDTFSKTDLIAVILDKNLTDCTYSDWQLKSNFPSSPKFIFTILLEYSCKSTFEQPVPTKIFNFSCKK